MAHGGDVQDAIGVLEFKPHRGSPTSGHDSEVHVSRVWAFRLATFDFILSTILTLLKSKD